MMNPETPQTTKRRLGAWKKPTACPGCDQPDTIGVARLPSVQEIQGADVRCEVDKWHCSACGAEWMSPEQATAAVGAAVRTYQRQNGLLTGDECREARKSIGWTQDELAAAADVGIATVKRLESGVHVIGSLHDSALRRTLDGAWFTCSTDDTWDVPWQAELEAPDMKALFGDVFLDDAYGLEDDGCLVAADSNELALAA